jgi:hypothetical protein
VTAMTLPLFNTSSAVFSDCGRYRYRLERRLPTGSRTMSVTMLNPSIADATKPDPTITKLLGFCSRLDVGRLIVTNLAALVSTDPKGLTEVGDPIGVENDAHILAAAMDADLLIVAWGAGVTMLRGLAADRVARVTEILRGRERLGGDGREVWCWGTSKHGHPRHPLMLAYTTPLELFSP